LDLLIARSSETQISPLQLGSFTREISTLDP